MTHARLHCPVCPEAPELVPTGRTDTLSGYLCLRCGSALTTPVMDSRPHAFPSTDDLTGHPTTRFVEIALAARARAERASVLSQQAGRLLTESERLIAEADQLLRDAN